MFRSICDWSLVLFLYVCGKVLHIKKYRPVRTPVDDKMYIVSFLFPLSANQRAKLLRLWHPRTIIILEAEKSLSVHSTTPSDPDWCEDNDWNNLFGRR